MRNFECEFVAEFLNKAVFSSNFHKFVLYFEKERVYVEYVLRRTMVVMRSWAQRGTTLTFWRRILDAKQVLVDELGRRGYTPTARHEGRSTCLFARPTTAARRRLAISSRLVETFDGRFEVLEAGLRSRGCSGHCGRGSTLLEPGLAMLWHRGLVQTDTTSSVRRVERRLELLVLIVHRTHAQTSQASVSGSTFLYLASTYGTLLLSIFLQWIYVQIVRI